MNGDKRCRSCGAMITRESLLTLSGMPNAVQNLPPDRDKAVASGIILDVVKCERCGLVQLANEPVPYFKDVVRAGSFSPSMRERQYHEFKTFIERFSLQDKKILEIGSGRGEYLSILNELPVNAFGMEHNPDACRIANENGLQTFQAYPADLHGPLNEMVFDAFISINFLEHTPAPGCFLRACANLLSENGVGMIAVPDFDFELRDNFFYSFMIDHLSYFSSGSLHNTLTLNGFDVVDLFRNEKLNVVTAYFRRRQLCDLSGTAEKFYNSNAEISRYTENILGGGGRIAVWGASHLAFSIISASQIAGRISYIVDSATFKQGRFTPASGLEIFPPAHLAEDPVDTVMIFCPEYSAEIIADIRNKFSDTVRRISTFVNGRLEIIQ